MTPQDREHNPQHTAPCADSRDENEPLRQRFIGCLLGTMLGDALGMPVEGWPPVEIVRHHGVVQSLLPARIGAGTYTDDTQMTMALAESLVHNRGFDGEDAAQRFLEAFDPDRGYGRGTREALTRLAAGVPWDEAGRSSFGVGSFGNGAAMRVAPIGLLYHRDLTVTAKVARLSGDPTHTHPLGRAGAAVQALAVALALRWALAGESSQSNTSFLQAIEQHLDSREGLFCERLETVGLLLERGAPPPLDDHSAMLRWAKDISSTLGHDARSFQSVPTAVYLFLARGADVEAALASAVALGGDTDTIAAMTGALLGAYHGAEGLPGHLLAGLEGGARGRDYLIGLADDLFLLWLEEFCAPASTRPLS